VAYSKVVVYHLLGWRKKSEITY